MMKDKSTTAISLFSAFLAYTTLTTPVTAKEHVPAQLFPAFEPGTTEEQKPLLLARFPEETLEAEPLACTALLVRNGDLEDDYSLYLNGERVYQGPREYVLAQREKLGCRPPLLGAKK